MILRDKNNFPINLEDIVIINQDGILYGEIAIISGLFISNSCELIYGNLQGTESIINLDPSMIEVIDNLRSTIFDVITWNERKRILCQMIDQATIAK